MTCERISGHFLRRNLFGGRLGSVEGTNLQFAVFGFCICDLKRFGPRLTYGGKQRPSLLGVGLHVAE